MVSEKVVNLQKGAIVAQALAQFMNIRIISKVDVLAGLDWPGQ